MGFGIFLDECGLPWSDYGNYKGMDIGAQNSILYVSEWGLLLWSKWISKSDNILLSSRWWKKIEDPIHQPRCREEALEQIAYCAKWLLKRIEHKGDFSVWTHPYQMSFGMKPGWRSAHSQGVALQLISRASEVRSDVSLQPVLEPLLRAFEVPVDDGGLRDTGDGDDWWYTKFAQNDVRTPRVLNGMLFSLLALLDVANRHGSERAAYLFSKGANEVLKVMGVFDRGDWTFYDSNRKLSSKHYHKIVVKQLSMLGRSSGIQKFKMLSSQFSEYTYNG